MQRSRWAAVIVATLVVAVAVPAGALNPIGTTPPTPVADGKALSSGHPVLKFAGHLDSPTPLPTISNPDPTLCAVNCQQWALTVDTKHPFLVSLHNGTESIEDGFNLYVYDPAGDQVASSAGIGSNGQAAIVEPTTRGTYIVAVTATYAYDANAAYLGEARIMAPPTWDMPTCNGARPCKLLPTLGVRPPADVHVDGVPPIASTPLGFPFPVDASTGNSCYADEIFRTGVTRCLRFTSEVDNVGIAPLTLQIPWADASTGSAAAVPGQCEAQQVIQMSDGTTRTRDAGPCEFHAAHGHFHYNNFVEFSLHKLAADGSTGAEVASSLKESFCLADDGYFGFGTAGPNGPRRFVGQPDCNVPSTPTPQAPDALITMGVAPGWGDIYTWDTPDQYIDISTTPPGTYDIVARANSDGTGLALAGPSRPCATTRITLTDTGVDVIKRGIPCS